MANRRKSRGRNINGILLLDKAVGISSNRALQRVRGIFNAKKAGHTGSLDPLASGLLPICLGEATKLSNYILNANKTYITECKLGVTTTTGDAEGEVLETKVVKALSKTEIEAVLQKFIGEIEQIPPMHSAIKQNGQPLYKLARQGIEVDRQARTVHIYDIELLSMTNESLHIKVSCSKGTYIRTLCEDIGRELGCGAYVGSLHREEVGVFHNNDAVTVQELQSLRDVQAFEELDKLVIPMEKALDDWPDVILCKDSAYYLRQGQPVLVPKAPTDGWVKLFDGESLFLGVGQVLDDGRVAPRRLVNTA